MQLEDKLKQLEETAQMLDNKDLSLNDAIGLFEKGVATVKDCINSLAESKGKIDGILAELNSIINSDEGDLI